jgi:sec-independent protein translocase protein TatB
VFDSIGWGEIIVLALAALFIFGPERLPGLAKDAASGLKRVRTAVTGIREQVNESLGDDLPELRDLDLRKYHPRTFIRSQLLGDDDAPPPNQTAPAATETTEPTGPGSAVANEDTTVGVLNGTTTNGLAGTIADRLNQEGGYAPGTTATNTRDQTLAESTVYYADGFRGQARDVAELLGVAAVEPLDDETQALAPDADVVVLAGADQAQ